MILESTIIVLYTVAIVLIFFYALAQLNLLFNYLSAQKKEDDCDVYDLEVLNEVPFVVIELSLLR